MPEAYMIQETKNGRILRDARGRFLPGTESKARITDARKSHELATMRREQKQAAIVAAANSAVESGRLHTEYGDLAFVAEIGAAAQRKATNIDDPKMIDAARFVLQEAGLSEKQQEQSAVSEVRELVDSLVSMVREAKANAV